MPTLAPRNLLHAPPRRRSIKAKVVVAILGSLILHGAVLLLVVWVVPHWPRPKLHHTPPPIHLTLSQSTPAPPPPVTNAPATRPDYIRTLDEQKADHPPEDPKFISSEDTKAAAENNATGDKPLPSQEGKNIPTYDFDTRPYRPGKEAADAASAAPSAPSAPEPPKTTENKKPAPHTKSLHAPKPAPTPVLPGELAALQPVNSPPPEPPVPSETPDEASAPPPRPNQSQAVSRNPSVTSPGLAHPPGYQPQTIKSRVSGSISNRGIAAPDAIGTPLGRYQKTLEDAIGMLWYQYVEDRMDVIGAGEVKIHFLVSRTGKVEGVRVSSGKANGALADISIQAVSEAPLPPIPPDVVDKLDNGQLEFDLGFGVYF